jgi:AcrR family transcriptional regulator
VAEEAGLKQQIVYYYFRTMDDLIVATFRRRTERALERLREALEADRPLHALWKLNSDAHTARLSAEFMVLANHNHAIRAEVASYLRQSRAMQAELLDRLLKAANIGPKTCSPAAASILIPCIAQYLDREETMGVTDGHAELRALIESWLGVLEPAGGWRAGKV